MNIYVPKPEEIPSGICECGCGQPTHTVTTTVRRKRHFRGHPSPFLYGHGRKKYGPDHHSWNGGRVLHKSTGYMLLRKPDHPEADLKGYVREHRYVMEQALGRPLERSEHVHHINGIKDDNRLENLVVLSKAAHNAHHAPDRKYDSEKMRQAGRKGAAARWGKGPTSARS